MEDPDLTVSTSLKKFKETANYFEKNYLLTKLKHNKQITFVCLI